MTLSQASIIFVDDEADSRLTMERLLTRAGFAVQTCDSASSALKLIGSTRADLLLTDMRMPGMDGLELLKQVKILQPDLPVVMYSGYATVQSAVQATKEGAEDYITKPCTENELLHVLNRVMDRRRLLAENQRLQQDLTERFNFHNIIGTSNEMQAVYRLVARTAPSMVNVVIAGETGTGKELVAKAIHYSGPRADRPLISINCAAIPENLLESELFGYRAGAFTGAARDKEGLFEAAGSGTLFLDEIGEMGMSTQIKLLRALDSREFRRLGETNVRKLNARIIAATNQDLAKLVESNGFRKDLYYRLAVVPLYIPPLRARKSDIPLLIDHFVEKYEAEWSGTKPGLTERAVALMMNYDWPGNVRELENLIHRLLTLTETTSISHLQLPAQFKAVAVERDQGTMNLESLATMEKRYIESVLSRISNKSEAARILNIDRKTLYSKIKQYGIQTLA